jgi:hypothetical protein
MHGAIYSVATAGGRRTQLLPADHDSCRSIKQSRKSSYCTAYCTTACTAHHALHLPDCHAPAVPPRVVPDWAGRKLGSQTPTNMGFQWVQPYVSASRFFSPFPVDSCTRMKHLDSASSSCNCKPPSRSAFRCIAHQ